MKKIAAILACVLAVAGNATAVEKNKAGDKVAKQKTPSFVTVGLELKGVNLGDSPEKIENEFAVDCRRGSCSTSFFAGIQRHNLIPEDKQRFATRLVQTYQFYFEDNKLIEMSISIPSDDFELVFLSLIAKFGKPQANETVDVQNAYGAKYSNVKGTWKAKDGNTISAERFFPNLELSYIVMRDSDYQKRINSSAKTPVNDL